MMSKISRILFTATAIVMIAISSPSTSNAQGRADNSLVGTWDMTIYFKDCTTGEVLRQRPGLISFMFGGVMQEFGTGQQIPQNRTDAQGTWSLSSGSSYASVAKTFRFNADGSYAGPVKLYRTIVLDRQSDTFEASVASEIYDLAGNLIARGCADEVGTRLQ
ncbi:MAG TPA: hypothetical protein VFZ23_00380 [Pyrinomonadaceae bacterium]